MAVASGLAATSANLPSRFVELLAVVTDFGDEVAGLFGAQPVLLGKILDFIGFARRYPTPVSTIRLAFVVCHETLRLPRVADITPYRRCVSHDIATGVPRDTPLPANPLIADRPLVGHRSTMGDQHDDFEQAAQIVEAFSESETDEHVLDLLSRIAAALRDQAIDN
jgi:hypothetical protein